MGDHRERVRLHLGCGPVYLAGWVNIDAVGAFAHERPDLVERHQTDLANYFKRPYKRRDLGHDERELHVVDVLADVTDLAGFEDSSVDDILSVNLIDHLRFEDLAAAVAEWRRVLRSSGRLVIDVGDARGNADLLREAQTRDEIEWALRLFYCHGRDEWDSHHWGYTPGYLDLLMAEWGFTPIWTRRDFIGHVYPAFQSCFGPA